MFRMRRYRLVLICALAITILLYHVSKNSQWEQDIWHDFDQRGRHHHNIRPKPRPEHAAPPPPPPPPPSSPPPPPPPLPPPPGPPPPSTHESDRHEQDGPYKPPHTGHYYDTDGPAPDKPPSDPSVKLPELKPDFDEESYQDYSLPTKVVSPNPSTADGQDGTNAEQPQPEFVPPTIPKMNPPPHKGPVLPPPGNGDDYGGTSPSATTIHWKKPKEWYPVPSESIIPLPTGKPKPIPRIQYQFDEESPVAKEKRELRRAKVKAEAKKAWEGYKMYAWGHDEVRPVSKQPKDPFCGWAATLVDSLDTLWIMGMKEEFEEAVQAVKNIDFTTTPYRTDIPVFETIIRYLGGLIGAYDVSGGEKGGYTILLDKAVELAEVLMSVFDTPNRMPVLYYHWMPDENITPKRASVVSVAELGSMTMEFTRLAQLTGKNKYYDAIARIVNELEALQNRENATAIPGVFPEQLDASGCNRTAALFNYLEQNQNPFESRELWHPAVDDEKAQEELPPPAGEGQVTGTPVQVPESHTGAGRNDQVGHSPGPKKRDLEQDYSSHRPEQVPESHDQASQQPKVPDQSPSQENKESSSQFTSQNSQFSQHSKEENTSNYLPSQDQPTTSDDECIPKPLTGVSGAAGSYSMGGSQDSTYEYFPKQYLLLGGLEPKYRAMYEKTAKGVTDYLLFRPMAEGDPDILFSAKAYSSDGTIENMSYEWETTHLTCFLGGMFGLGGKIFDRPEDVEIGKRLADGCVWAYDMMPTGIMPERALLVPCRKAEDCHWNKTAWYEELDPNAEWRERQMEEYYVKKAEWNRKVEEAKRIEEERKAAEAAAAQTGNNTAQGQSQEGVVSLPEQQQQFGEGNPSHPLAREEMHTVHSSPSPSPSRPSNLAKRDIPPGGIRDPVSQQILYEPVRPQTHKEFVEDRIKKENLKPGFSHLSDRRYILRPEAIESVWYMYRITGDPSWQEKGWRMFEAIIRATSTDIAHSAIADVAPVDGATPSQEDSMESFWMAETLKYFYLLFETPDVISLDEWVLNTEAHPFRRPKADA